jgi:putative oxidoreductase
MRSRCGSSSGSVLCSTAMQSWHAGLRISLTCYMPWGFQFPSFWGWAIIVVELVGGLMILAGALIPLATVPLAIVLLVAIFTVHLPNGFSSIKLQSFDVAGAHFGQPGYETDLLYLAGLVALCLGGPGPLSIDGLLNRFKRFGAAEA